ncbi:MAG: hypothetical protein Q8S09_16365 [Hyphomonas sp.]|nr:hypothetical protein [Hyphomonas sp.]
MEGTFTLQTESKADFENRRDTYQHYQKQKSATMMAIHVGVEAYLINNSQVIAIDQQGRAVSVGLQIFVFGGELPITEEESARGVEILARDALERL